MVNKKRSQERIPKQKNQKDQEQHDNHKKVNEKEEFSDVPILSASDIERFGYCPMSWWLNYQGLKVTNERLKKGSDDHKRIIEKVSTVKEKEKVSKISEFNIKIFAIIASMLALNGVAILLPYPLIRNFLIYIAIIWIVFALIYFIYYLFQSKYSKTKHIFQTIQSSITSKKNQTQTNNDSDEQQSLFHTSPQTWKRSAIWFLIIAGGLAFNGFTYFQPYEPKIMSRIYMISALLWLIGTAAILYFVLRFEEAQRNKAIEQISDKKNKSRYSLTESEKLIIGFAIVATLLAINGLTIQSRDIFSEFTLVGQIIMVLAALWLGVSFAFLYISFRGGVVTRTFAKDFNKATSESRKYEIIIDKIKTPPIIDRIFSYNWPFLFTIIAVILGINSIIIRYGTEIMNEQSEIFSRFLVIIAILWLLGSFIFLYDVLKNAELAGEIRRLHGIYKGKIEYTDKLDNKSKMLFSKKYKIRGKPDYIVKIKGKYLPVELKTGKVPRGPHFSHIIQIAAYCLLIHENYGIRPGYGIISYGKDNRHKITYDEKLENLLKEKLDDMRTCIINDTAHRNHRRLGKCRNCSRHDNCDERLV